MQGCSHYVDRMWYLPPMADDGCQRVIGESAGVSLAGHWRRQLYKVDENVSYDRDDGQIVLHGANLMVV